MKILIYGEWMVFVEEINPSGRKSRLLPLKMFASFIKKDYETATVATVVDPM